MGLFTKRPEAIAAQQGDWLMIVVEVEERKNDFRKISFYPIIAWRKYKDVNYIFPEYRVSIPEYEAPYADGLPQAFHVRGGLVYDMNDGLSRGSLKKFLMEFVYEGSILFSSTGVPQEFLPITEPIFAESKKRNEIVQE